MKKVTIILLLLGLLLLTACGSNNESKESASSASGQQAESKGYLDVIKQRGKLIAGVKYDTNLFGLLDPADNKVKGFDVDIMHELANQMFGSPDAVEFKQVTSKTRIPMLENGDIDMIAATMTITEERKQQVDFSNVYFKAGQSLLVPQGSPITGIQDLKGKTVLVVKGSTSEKNIMEQAPDAAVKQYENYQDAFSALRSGKGDALTTDNAILIGMKLQDPNYNLVGGLFTDEPYGLAIQKGHDDFVQYVNQFLDEIESNGKYKELYVKWFNEEPPTK